ncbi:MAG: DsbA family oxidoreductase [Chitinophagaceae bacterium]|nr:DsbA family oxidoreductase [Chitinophagaceae bacterium]
MKVEIWSDIMCPFCYIGKRRFEEALGKFEDHNNIAIEWKSFQLDPTIQPAPGKNVYEYLAERKGISYEQSEQMHERVIAMAKDAGLEYNFDKAIIANSYDAHRLIQLAKKNKLGDAAEERLFKAYFTEGKDFGNHETLAQIGKEIGLDENKVRQALATNEFSNEVDADIYEAQQIGVRGVPFFVFNRRYAVSGAQASDTFLDVLNKSFAEWKKENPLQQLNITEGEVCEPGSDC